MLSFPPWLAGVLVRAGCLSGSSYNCVTPTITSRILRGQDEEYPVKQEDWVYRSQGVEDYDQGFTWSSDVAIGGPRESSRAQSKSGGALLT